MVTADLASSDYLREIHGNIGRLADVMGAAARPEQTVVSVICTAVTGVGAYLPPDIVTNADIAKIVDTTDAWIFERTGIRERRRAAPDQACSDLAVEAARKALAAAGRRPRTLT